MAGGLGKGSGCLTYPVQGSTETTEQLSDSPGRRRHGDRLSGCLTHPVEGGTETVGEQTAADGQLAGDGVQIEEALGGVVADQLVPNAFLRKYKGRMVE